jgi:hypothetical protein
MYLSFTIAAGFRQSSHSQVRVPRVSWPYFTNPDSKLPQPGELGPRIYFPQEQGGSVILPGTGSIFVASCNFLGYEGDIWLLQCDIEHQTYISQKKSFRKQGNFPLNF